ncbi:hypothetical protein JJC03_01940 [Flavobacterium oreochromis]|nr:hypothetical protein [Flavobacterium oreochromis]QYS86807.1 hypothetical protein JJC03_01940 [Flavobacterium oreochromis]
MKHYLIHFSLLVLTSFMKLSGQETFENRAKQIALQIETIAQEEKEKLKEQVEKINQDFLKGTLSKEEADQNKLKLAQETAHTIEKRTVIEENKLTALVREKVEGRIQILDTLQKKKKIGIHWNKKKMDSIGYSERRHTTQFVFVAGVNNLVTNNSINGSDFRYWGSHFYEWGFSMNSRILKTNNLLHFKHGISFQYNNLRPTNNRFFVEEGDQTTLRAFPKPINDSRFKVVNLVFPMYLELDFSKSPMINGKKYFHTHKSFRLGVGGF